MNTKKIWPYKFTLHDNIFYIDNSLKKMTRERWEGILECKRRFLSDENYDPRECPYMDPDIANSWVRCRKMGLDPLQTSLGLTLKSDEFNAIQEKNRMLCEITKPLFTAFKNIAASTGYVLYLTDNNGVFLLSEGELPVLPPDHAPLIGMLWDEKNSGTTAHSMSIRHRRPIHLMGPENYCQVLANNFASASPIYDKNGDMIATLVLVQIWVNEPWTESHQNFVSHTMGLITALGAAIETQLQLRQSFTSLKMANETLEATLALIDEGIITIDKKGTIIYGNEEGRKIFKLAPDEVGTKNIKEFLGEDSSLLAMAQRGESGTIEETIYLGQDDEQYIVSIQPIMDEDIHELDVAMLTVNHAGKINAITTNRVGTVARFTFGDIIGESDEIKKAITKGKYYSNAEENLLLIGESGTGKEVFAQAIHNKYCPNGPFIAVNCAALPRELIESELFGYEGGSFTGADRGGRPGKIELAEGGTLFLDEIGDMPFELQAVLLRVLEDKQVMRLGGRRYKKVNFRVIAATNHNLNKMVTEKLFREDLYYRLSVLKIIIPPLRDRHNDAEILAKYFIRKYCSKMGRKEPKLSLPVIEIIKKYNWPGNVRELENAMVYAVINAPGDMIEVQDIPDDILSKINSQTADHEMYGKRDYNQDDIIPLCDLEKDAIEIAMKKTDGNVIHASYLLGISKSTFYRKLKKYGIPF